MRSLVISASVVGIGCLAALPFRKTSEPQPDLTSQLSNPGYESPLKEVGDEIADDVQIDELPSEAKVPLYGSPPEPVVKMPELPTSRRPFSKDIVEPVPYMTQEAGQPEPTSVASTDQPLDWEKSGTVGVETDEPASAIARTISNKVSKPEDDDALKAPSELVEAVDSGSVAQSVGAPVVASSRFSTTEVTQPEQPRRRYFIYEPAN